MQTAEQRLETLERATNTINAAQLNALSALVRAVTKLDGLDRQALYDDLQDAKEVQVQNGDQPQYLQILSMIQANIS